jgi:hypothetical protein
MSSSVSHLPQKLTVLPGLLAEIAVVADGGNAIGTPGD